MYKVVEGLVPALPTDNFVGHLYGIRTLLDRVQYLEALQSLLMFPLNFHLQTSPKTPEEKKDTNKFKPWFQIRIFL
jgi:hypothetical protein